MEAVVDPGEVILDEVAEIRARIARYEALLADKLLAFQEQTGSFGTLLYAGKDWQDPVLARRSMILMAEKVMPLVNAAVLNKSTARRPVEAAMPA